MMFWLIIVEMKRNILSLETKLCPEDFQGLRHCRVRWYHESRKRKPSSDLPQVHRVRRREMFSMHDSPCKIQTSKTVIRLDKLNRSVWNSIRIWFVEQNQWVDRMQRERGSIDHTFDSSCLAQIFVSSSILLRTHEARSEQCERIRGTYDFVFVCWETHRSSKLLKRRWGKDSLMGFIGPYGSILILIIINALTAHFLMISRSSIPKTSTILSDS